MSPSYSLGSPPNKIHQQGSETIKEPGSSGPVRSNPSQSVEFSKKETYIHSVGKETEEKAPEKLHGAFEEGKSKEAGPTARPDPEPSSQGK